MCSAGEEVAGLAIFHWPRFGGFPFGYTGCERVGRPDLGGYRVADGDLRGHGLDGEQHREDKEEE